MTTSQKIAACLWFNGQAEEAAAFYTSLFNNTGITRTTRYNEEGQEIHGHKAGEVMTVEFDLENLHFVALNGGPEFNFNSSISFSVTCLSENEIDELWKKLHEGGATMMPLEKYEWSPKYGWVRDRFGVNWQLSLDSAATERSIIPSFLFTAERRGMAEEALNLYASVFKESNVEIISRYPDEAGEVAGMIQYSQINLEGQAITLMDSGVEMDAPFSEAISLIVYCENQQEVDYYWDKLKEGGDPKAQVCGWLKDKFGVSWQVVPRSLDAMFEDEKSEKSKRAMRAMLQMKKLDIAELERAYEGR